MILLHTSSSSYASAELSLFLYNIDFFNSIKLCIFFSTFPADILRSK